MSSVKQILIVAITEYQDTILKAAVLITAKGHFDR